MELIFNARRFAIKVIILLLYAAILLWFSTFSYGLVYYLYIPAVAHVRPIYLQHDGGCVKRVCKYPTANVSLVKPGYRQLLSGGQKYEVEVALEMPESEANVNQGMFMIELSMMSENGAILQTSKRPAVLRYRSPLFRVIQTLFFSPALLAGTFEEKQNLVVPLYESYIEDSNQPTHFAFIEIQARYAEIYSSSLQIHAQFTGLRYFMYYWPLFSAFMGIGSTFFSLCIMTLLTWMRYVMISPVDEVMSTRTRISSTKVSLPTDLADRSVAMAHLLSGDIQGQQVSPLHVGRGVEVISSEKGHLDSPQIQELPDDESELVTSLRRRNL